MRRGHGIHGDHWRPVGFYCQLPDWVTDLIRARPYSNFLCDRRHEPMCLFLGLRAMPFVSPAKLRVCSPLDLGHVVILAILRRILQ